MKREERIQNKVKCLLRKLNAPRWLHHFGPKTYEFYMHLVALLIRSYCKLSYRRIVKLLNLLGGLYAQANLLCKTPQRRFLNGCGIKH